MSSDDKLNMCSLHPRYDGTYKPDGSCARCLAQWVATQAERYARAEFAISDASQSVRKVMLPLPPRTPA